MKSSFYDYSHKWCFSGGQMTPIHFAANLLLASTRASLMTLGIVTWSHLERSGAIQSYLEQCGAIRAFWSHLDSDSLLHHVLRQVVSGPRTGPSRIGGPRLLRGHSGGHLTQTMMRV